MPSATVVKEAVKGALLPSEESPDLSAQSRARFTANAVKDAKTGELYLDLDNFISAVAPKTEDYVSRPKMTALDLAAPLAPWHAAG